MLVGKASSSSQHSLSHDFSRIFRKDGITLGLSSLSNQKMLFSQRSNRETGSAAPAVTSSREQEPRGSSTIELPVAWHQPGVRKGHSREKSGPRGGRASLGSDRWSPLHNWRFALSFVILMRVPGSVFFHILSFLVSQAMVTALQEMGRR